MVDELAHFFGRAISTLIFGGDPGLSSLFDNLLADEVRAFGQARRRSGNRPAWWRLSRSIREQRFKSLHIRMLPCMVGVTP